MKALAPLLLSLTLIGCVTTPPENHWPTDMPQKQLFVSYYGLDKAHQQKMSEENYLKWIKRFWLGWELYPRGWLQVIDEMSSSLPLTEDKQTAVTRMQTIGLLVSAEWAKEDPHRIINTRHLGVWGSALNQSILQKTQLVTLQEIQTDVQAILDLQLDPTMINADRYYHEEEFQGSGNF